MIRSWAEHQLNMDFSNIDTPQGRPSDIDMWYISKTNFLIIGEIKNEMGYFTDGQKHLLAKLIDQHKGDIVDGRRKRHAMVVSNTAWE